MGQYYENKPIKLQVDGGTLLVTTPESPNQKKRRLVTEELFPSIFLSMGQAFNYDIPVKNNLISLHSVAFLPYGDTSTKFLQNFAKTLETALAKHRIVFISDQHDSSTCALGTALLLLNAGLPDESRKTNPVHYFFEFQFFNITYKDRPAEITYLESRESTLWKLGTALFKDDAKSVKRAVALAQKEFPYTDFSSVTRYLARPTKQSGWEAFKCIGTLRSEQWSKTILTYMNQEDNRDKKYVVNVGSAHIEELVHLLKHAESCANDGINRVPSIGV